MNFFLGKEKKKKKKEGNKRRDVGAKPTLNRYYCTLLRYIYKSGSGAATPFFLIFFNLF